MKLAVMAQAVCSQNGAYVSLRHLEGDFLASYLQVGYLAEFSP